MKGLYSFISLRTCKDDFNPDTGTFLFLFGAGRLTGLSGLENRVCECSLALLRLFSVKSSLSLVAVNYSFHSTLRSDPSPLVNISKHFLEVIMNPGQRSVSTRELFNIINSWFFSRSVLHSPSNGGIQRNVLLRSYQRLCISDGWTECLRDRHFSSDCQRRALPEAQPLMSSLSSPNYERLWL